MEVRKMDSCLDHLKSKGKLKAVNPVVAAYQIAYERAPADFRIQIVETEAGGFIGYANYGIWGPEQSEPYRGEHGADSIKKALIEVLKDIDEFDDSSISDRELIWESNDKTLYDGTGAEITLKEAENRRDDWRKREAHKKRL
jgi:hypothetical protein